MTYWLHNLSPFALQFGENFGVRWYGLAYAAGLLIAWAFLIRLCKRGALPLDAHARAQFLFYQLLGIIIGGRLGFMLLYDFGSFIAYPLRFFFFWQGGMSSHGGLLGSALASLLFARRRKVSFWLLADATCVMAPAGLLLGRLANFINGELWGKIAYVPWAVIFPKSAPEGTPVSLIAPRHPSQLYEAALEGLFLLLYTQLRARQTRLQPAGRLTAEFLILYALVRIVGEGFREPDASLILGLSRGVFYSLFMLPVGAWLWLRTSRKKSK